MEPARSVRALSDAAYDLLMAASPVDATQLGDRRFDTQLPDLTPQGRRSLLTALDGLRAELAGIDPATLPAADRVTRDVTEHVLAMAHHEVAGGYVQFAAGPMASGSTIGGAASALLISLPKLPVETAEHAAAHVARCRAIPAHLAAAEHQLRAGIAAGRTPARRLVDATARQVARYLATDGEHDPLVVDSAAWHDDARDELRAALADEIRPAFARHAAVLTDEVAPQARSDDQVGLCWVPGGADLYREAVALHTTTQATPEELHQLGLDLVAELAGAYRDLGGAALGTTDLGRIFTQLRDDPELRFSSATQVLDTAQAALGRAQATAGNWFGALPATPCEVREIPEVEAPESTIAYYHPPTLDGRPGAYFVNTSDPTTRTRFEAEALAFHESVPGHHLQIARAMELDLPVLQRVFYVTAFAEGWGLYAERLADEMELYSDQPARLGMLSFDSWRACRLVVDTGMHALGWSRDRAVAFMRDNSPQAHNNIDNEVDRYIGWPAQALAYMTGRTRIAALRARAEETLGDAFDIAAFHDVVLGQAAVPLWTLDRVVGEWIAGGGQASA